MEWATIFSQPITQIGGLIGIIALLQNRGVDVGKLVRGFLGVRGVDTASETDASLRNDFQALMGQMEILTAHFNHETTDSQIRIETALTKMIEKQDQTNQVLQEVLKYGIKCRKE